MTQLQQKVITMTSHYCLSQKILNLSVMKLDGRCKPIVIISVDGKSTSDSSISDGCLFVFKVDLMKILDIQKHYLTVCNFLKTMNLTVYSWYQIVRVGQHITWLNDEWLYFQINWLVIQLNIDY